MMGAATAKVVKLKPKQGFGAMLKKTAVAKQPAKSKSKMPVLDPPEDVREAVDEYIDAKTRETMAKADKQMAETVVLQFTSNVQDKDGFKGKFQNSYALPGNKTGNQVKYVSSNRYSINAADRDLLEEALGELYADMVEENYTVKVKAEVFTDEELQAELMELIGDRFEDFFENTLTLKVQEGFNRRIYQVPMEENGLDNLRVFCKPYKPALK